MEPTGGARLLWWMQTRRPTNRHRGGAFAAAAVELRFVQQCFAGFSGKVPRASEGANKMDMVSVHDVV